jgi:hypothetical protein
MKIPMPFPLGGVGWKKHIFQKPKLPPQALSANLRLHKPAHGIKLVASRLSGGKYMPLGTLDVMKLDGQPLTYQIMFEQNAGGTFVTRIESDELVPFLHEEMRVELPTVESAAQRLRNESRVRLQGIFLEENNLHAVMDYMEEEI